MIIILAWQFSDWVSPVFKEIYAVDIKKLIFFSNDSIDLSPVFVKHIK